MPILSGTQSGSIQAILRGLNTRFWLVHSTTFSPTMRQIVRAERRRSHLPFEKRRPSSGRQWRRSHLDLTSVWTISANFLSSCLSFSTSATSLFHLALLFSRREKSKSCGKFHIRWGRVHLELRPPVSGTAPTLPEREAFLDMTSKGSKTRHCRAETSITSPQTPAVTALDHDGQMC